MNYLIEMSLFTSQDLVTFDFKVGFKKLVMVAMMYKVDMFNKVVMLD